MQRFIIVACIPEKATCHVKGITGYWLDQSVLVDQALDRPSIGLSIGPSRTKITMLNITEAETREALFFFSADQASENKELL